MSSLMSLDPSHAERAKRSNVWQFCSLLNPNLAMCNLCKMNIKYHRTHNLKNHLKTAHGITVVKVTKSSQGPQISWFLQKLKFYLLSNTFKCYFLKTSIKKVLMLIASPPCLFQGPEVVSQLAPLGSKNPSFGITWPRKEVTKWLAVFAAKF